MRIVEFVGGFYGFVVGLGEVEFELIVVVLWIVDFEGGLG